MNPPDAIPPGCTADQWRMLLAWIHESESRKDLAREGATTEKSSANASPPSPAQDYDWFLAEGQIRVIGPQALAAPELLFAVILEADEVGYWLIVPFSPYASPALPGEWATGLPAPAFKVLCLDLAQMVPAQFLLKTRVLSSLADEEVATLKNLLAQRDQALIGAGDISEAQQARLGPPMYPGAADPRTQYVVARRKLTDLIDHQVARLHKAMETWATGVILSEPLPLAAGTDTRLCRLVVVDRQGKALDHFKSGYARFTPGNPRPDADGTLNAVSEWEIAGLDATHLAQISHSTLVWFDPQSGDSIGTGAVSDDGRHARLLNGHWPQVQRVLPRLPHTVLILHLP